MLPQQQSQARQHTYSLLSRLFQYGITADLLPYLEAVPDLKSHLPFPFDPDEAAADYYNIFVFNIYPNASIFLDDSRLLGGPITVAHSALYQANHFAPDSAVDADHLSQSLAFLAHLSKTETDVLEKGNAPNFIQFQLYNFLQNHFLAWIIPCTIAIQQQNKPFYTQLGQLTIALTADHFLDLNSNQPPPQLPPSNTNNYSTNRLNNRSTTLRDIARYLITPALSGIYLSRSAITQLARYLNLPHGFGSREQMLQTLLQTTGQYDVTSDLFTALNDILTTWQQAYKKTGNDFPHIAHHVDPWHGRIHQTRQLLSYMQSQMENQDEPMEQGVITI